MTGDQTPRPRIGVQAMMLRDAVAELGAYEAFRRASAIGYHVAELSQIPMTPETVRELQRARDDFGFNFCATSTALSAGTPNDSLGEHFEKVVSDARALGSEMVRIGMLPFGALRSFPAVQDFCSRAEDAARRLADEGIALYYHNHHMEFAKHEGRFLLDLMTELSPHVGIELDAHWIARGGLDPARMIEQHAGRVRMVHLKDYRIAWPESRLLDSLEQGDMQAWVEMRGALVQFAEVGEGNLDWRQIITASIDSGAEYLLVEQDELYGVSVWDALTTSHRNLVTLGYGDFF